MRKEAAQIKEKGLSEIEQQKSRVISEIRSEVIDISIEIASKILRKTITSEEAEKLSDDVIKNLGDMKS